MAFNSSILTLPIRVIQAVFALIVLGVLAYGSFLFPSRPSLSLPPSIPLLLSPVPHHIPLTRMEHSASDHWGWSSPSSINFLVFVSVWTLLALVYLVLAPARFPAYAHKYGILGAEFVTMLFWFAGFIALASRLSHVRCGSKGGKYWGSCRAAIAGDVFAAFEW